MRAILAANLLRSKGWHAYAAVGMVCDAVTHCRFAHTDASSDDTVFFSLLDVRAVPTRRGVPPPALVVCIMLPRLLTLAGAGVPQSTGLRGAARVLCWPLPD